MAVELSLSEAEEVYGNELEEESEKHITMAPERA